MKIIMSALFILIIALIFFVIGGLLWPYSIHAWGLIMHKEIHVEFWQGGLLGIAPIVGQLSIPIAIITWICMLFLKG